MKRLPLIQKRGGLLILLLLCLLGCATESNDASTPASVPTLTKTATAPATSAPVKTLISETALPPTAVPAPTEIVVTEMATEEVVAQPTAPTDQIFTQGYGVYHPRTSGPFDLISAAPSHLFEWSHSTHPAMSADGRYIVYETKLENFMLPDASSGIVPDESVIVYLDTVTGVLIIVSKDQNGQFVNAVTPSISADGKFVTFYSRDSGIVNQPVNEGYNQYVYDVTNETIDLLNVPEFVAEAVALDNSRGACDLALSQNGQMITFNIRKRIYIKNMLTDEITLLTKTPDGEPMENVGISCPHISADGTEVFTHLSPHNSADASIERGIHVFDVATGSYEFLVTAETKFSVSADGNLLAVFRYDEGILIYDRRSGDTTFASDIVARTNPSHHDQHFQLSADGEHLIAWNNVPWSMTVHHLSAGETELLPFSLEEGAEGWFTNNGGSGSYDYISISPQISADGSHILFSTDRGDFFVEDVYGRADVIRYNANSTSQSLSEPTAFITQDE